MRPGKKNRHFGADIHDPKARTSMTPGSRLLLQARWLYVKKAKFYPVNVALVTAKVDADSLLENGQILGDLLCQ